MLDADGAASAGGAGTQGGETENPLAFEPASAAGSSRAFSEKEKAGNAGSAGPFQKAGSILGTG